MDLIILKDFLADYSLPTIVIAFSVSLIYFIINSVFKNKLKSAIKAKITFILSTVIYIAYDMIFVSHAFTITSDSVYAGIICGSLSGITSSVIRRFFKGKSVHLSVTALLIENILTEYISDDSITVVATEIEKIIAVNMEKDVTIEEINSVLTDSGADFTSMEEMNDIASLIYQSVKAIDEN